jgi:hypothetical protein
MNSTPEIKMRVQAFDVEHHTHLFEMVSQYLFYWRGLVFEQRLSNQHFHKMEEQLWQRLESEKWNGSPKQLNEICGAIEQEFVAR